MLLLHINGTITKLDSVLLDREIQSILGVVLSTQCRDLLPSAICEHCDVALIIEFVNNINVGSLDRYYIQHPKNTPTMKGTLSFIFLFIAFAHMTGAVPTIAQRNPGDFLVPLLALCILLTMLMA